MFREKVPVYSAVLICYLGLISLFRWPFGFEIVWWWFGGLFGLFLYNLDHVIYLLWQAPKEVTAIEFKKLLVERKIKNAFALLCQTNQERTRLVGHSVIFQLALVVVTFFAVSSTASLFGKGLVMGMFFYSLINQGQLLLKGKGLLSWFWQVGFKISAKAEAFYFLGLLVLLFFFSRYLI